MRAISASFSKYISFIVIYITKEILEKILFKSIKKQIFDKYTHTYNIYIYILIANCSNVFIQSVIIYIINIYSVIIYIINI